MGAIRDETDNAHNGSYNGSLYQQTGAVGYSLGFDGNNDVVIVPASPDFNMGGGDFSICFWIKWNTYVANKVVLNQVDPKGCGFMWTNSAAQAPFYWYAVFSGSGGVYLIFSGVPTVNGTWYHCGVVRDGDVMRAYWNGAEVNNIAAVGSISDRTNDVELGGRDGSTDTINGDLDEFIIWKGVALTPAEMVDYEKWSYTY